MNQLIFTLDKETKSYFILETNDEKLFVIAQLLLDVHALDAFMKFTHSEEKRVFVGRFHFHRSNHTLFIIDLFADHEILEEQDRVLTIEIERTNIEYLIKRWFEVSKTSQEYITLTRVQDTYTLE